MMDAGRELDALVAEKVMGIASVGQAMTAEDTDWYDGEGRPIPHYSTDMVAVWLVVEAMRAKGFCFLLSDHTPNGLRIVEFFDGEDGADGSADTDALAICRVALKACGVEVPDAD